MEENQAKTGKFALTYGLILGGINLVFIIMLYSMDMHYQNEWPTVVIGLSIMIAMIVVGMLQFKKANNGFMSFGQALKVGVGICLISGVIGIIVSQIMTNFIDPEMIDKATEFARNKMLAETALTPEQIDAQLEMGAKFQTPVMQIVFGLVINIVLGFIFSLIPALVLKKQEVLD